MFQDFANTLEGAEVEVYYYWFTLLLSFILLRFLVFLEIFQGDDVLSSRRSKSSRRGRNNQSRHWRGRDGNQPHLLHTSKTIGKNQKKKKINLKPLPPNPRPLLIPKNLSPLPLQPTHILPMPKFPLRQPRSRTIMTRPQIPKHMFLSFLPIINSYLSDNATRQTLRSRVQRARKFRKPHLRPPLGAMARGVVAAHGDCGVVV